MWKGAKHKIQQACSDKEQGSLPELVEEKKQKNNSSCVVKKNPITYAMLLEGEDTEKPLGQEHPKKGEKYA